LVKGEKINISKINDYSNNLTIIFLYNNNVEISFAIDIFLFMLDDNNKINREEIVFYNNPENTEKSIRFVENYGSLENKKSYDVDLNAIPKNISKLILGCSIYKNKENLTELNPVNITLKVFNRTSNIEMFNLVMQSEIPTSQAIVIGEIYKHNEFWKFSAVEYVSSTNLLDSIKMLYSANFT
jgi:Uncharacterized proteins involved in stress response, homologs of TerZ and putative cAMP-binding protein CABP1